MCRIKKTILFVLLLAMTFILCTSCAGSQQPSEPGNNQYPNEFNTVQLEPDPTEETGLDFDLPENYQEMAKEFASTFTFNWATAYRGRNGQLLQATLDEYSGMIDRPSPYNDIVTEWNNSHSNLSNVHQPYVAGPTISSVTVQDIVNTLEKHQKGHRQSM